MTARYDAVVLAGGSGSRFGGGKLLAPFRGGELIDGALRAAFAAPVETVVVVTGYDRDRVGESVTAFAERHGGDRPWRIVHATAYAEGMAATLRTGVAAIGADRDGAFVFLGDMPAIPAHVPQMLADVLGAHAAAAPIHQGVRGHPVLVSRRLFPDLLALEGDTGARAILDRLGADLMLAQVDDPGVLFDVDRWADLLH
jgi:molybdenum cofactor cytidylyltransferase